MDTTQIIFSIIQTLTLIVAAYIAWKAPIEAVKVGRELSQEQQKQDAKMSLFLTLFGQRGMPIHKKEYVEQLNKINVVFYDVPTVLSAWKEYQNSLSITNQINQEQTWLILKINLLSEMATHLGYSGIKQTVIQEHYYPHGLGQETSTDAELRREAIQFLKAGNLFFESVLTARNEQSEDTSESNP